MHSTIEFAKCIHPCCKYAERKSWDNRMGSIYCLIKLRNPGRLGAEI